MSHSAVDKLADKTQKFDFSIEKKMTFHCYRANISTKDLIEPIDLVCQTLWNSDIRGCVETTWKGKCLPLILSWFLVRNKNEFFLNSL